MAASKSALVHHLAHHPLDHVVLDERRARSPPATGPASARSTAASATGSKHVTGSDAIGRSTTPAPTPRRPTPEERRVSPLRPRSEACQTGARQLRRPSAIDAAGLAERPALVPGHLGLVDAAERGVRILVGDEVLDLLERVAVVPVERIALDPRPGPYRSDASRRSLTCGHHGSRNRATAAAPVRRDSVVSGQTDTCRGRRSSVLAARSPLAAARAFSAILGGSPHAHGLSRHAIGTRSRLRPLLPAVFSFALILRAL